MKRLMLLLLPLAACQQGGDNATTAEGVDPADVAAKAALLFDPGQWETTTTITGIEMGDMPGEVASRMIGTETNFSHCMTPEEARRSPGDLFRKSAEGSCTYERFDMDGGTIDARMQCAGGDEGGSSTIDMSGSYSRDSYDMEMVMTVSAPQLPNAMTMKATSAGRRTGACTPSDGKEG